MRQWWWFAAMLSVISAPAAFGAWDGPPDDGFTDWFLVDNQTTACRNINPQAVRDYKNSPNKLPEWMTGKTGPTTPSEWLATLRTQGKNPHTFLVNEPYAFGSVGFIFENVWYKEGDKVVSLNFFQKQDICQYLVAHQELPTNLDTVVMTIDNDKAVTMTRQEFNEKVLTVGR
jgi:hypothetical protein